MHHCYLTSNRLNLKPSICWIWSHLFVEFEAIYLLNLKPSICWIWSIYLLNLKPSICWIWSHLFVEFEAIYLLNLKPSICWIWSHLFVEFEAIYLLNLKPSICWIWSHLFVEFKLENHGKIVRILIFNDQNLSPWSIFFLWSTCEWTFLLYLFWMMQFMLCLWFSNLAVWNR